MKIRTKIAIAALTAVFIAAVLFLNDASRGRNYAWSIICASNLKELGAAIATYARDHDGKLPERIGDLDRYIVSKQILYCPSARSTNHLSYTFTHATNLWGVSSNVVIVTESESPHYGGRNVLFDDGRVELQTPNPVLLPTAASPSH